MADIQEIDYDQIITKASNLAEAADSMQNAIKESFKKIEQMSENWFGNSYDQFINVVNMSIMSLNTLFETTVSDIPHEIAAKARSYAAANQSTVGAAFNDKTAIILTEVPKTNKGSKLRFRSDAVQGNQKGIEASFKEAVSNADKASSIATSLSNEWRSISGDTNISELKNAFVRLKLIIERLSSALSNQITAQENTINAIETAANAVESAKKVAGDAIDNVADAASSVVSKIQQSASELWTNLTGKN